MNKALIFMALLALAACGADAPPLTPTGSFGISAGSGGVETSTTMGLTNGTVSFGLSL